MNYLDIVIAIILFLFGIKGLRKGLIVEVVTLLAFGVGIYGAMRFSDFTAERLQEVMTIDPKYLNTVAFLLTFMPVTNALSVPKITQSLTLRRCLKYTAENIPADAKRRMYSAYDYLKNMDNGEKYIDTHYSEERIAELLGDAVTGDDDDYTLSGFTESRSFSCKMMDLDITGFDTITSFQNKYYMDEYKRKIDSIPIYRVALNSYGSEDDSFDTFDATELIELMQSYNFENKYGSEAEPLIFDQDGKRFVITEAFVSYDSLSGEIETLDIEGLLLMKNHN